MPNELPIHAITKHKSYPLSTVFGSFNSPRWADVSVYMAKEIRDSPVTCMTVISIKLRKLDLETPASTIAINTLRDRLKAEEITSMKNLTPHTAACRETHLNSAQRNQQIIVVITARLQTSCAKVDFFEDSGLRQSDRLDMTLLSQPSA